MNIFTLFAFEQQKRSGNSSMNNMTATLMKIYIHTLHTHKNGPGQTAKNRRMTGLTQEKQHISYYSSPL